MRTESAIKSRTIPACEIPEQFENLLGEKRYDVYLTQTFQNQYL